MHCFSSTCTNFIIRRTSPGCISFRTDITRIKYLMQPEKSVHSGGRTFSGSARSTEQFPDAPLVMGQQFSSGMTIGQGSSFLKIIQSSFSLPEIIKALLGMFLMHRIWNLFSCYPSQKMPMRS